ncbi:Hypp5857 [Branchiostoma lanceolatum]|uniref:Hypp5857 protein n=1 Tax=Branchiostoma lanceolatum TaxID=7740 RepID=A0A8J9VS22_BRALA|nr:Hypp5857 [Branchiostoma lanceolatum]
MKTLHACLLSSVLMLLVFWSSAESLPYQQGLGEMDRAQLDDEISTPYDDIVDTKEAAYWILRKALLENLLGKAAHARSQQNVMDPDEESRESLRTTVVQRAAKRWKVKCNNAYWKFCKG